MKPADAEALLEQQDYLTVPERLVFVFLLRRGDNLNCSIPKNLTPRLALVANRCGIAPRSLRRYLAHLHTHGWVLYEAARGSGRKGRMDVVPRVPDMVCRCPKVSHQAEKVAPAGASRSGPPGGRLKVAPRARASASPPAETVSTVQEARKGKRLGEVSVVEIEVPQQRVRESGPLATVTPLRKPGALVWVPSLQDLRDQYPSTRSPQADALWCAGYDR